MKKIRTLFIVNIIQIVLLIASVVAAVVLLPNVMLFNNVDVPAVVTIGTDDDAYNGYAQVTSYGAVPNDGKDDTKAFKAALKTNASIYVPAGVYEVKETIVIDNKTLKGCGSANTVIRSSADKTAVMLSGSAVVEEISIEFSEKSITGNEKSGERVAVLDNGLANGSMLRGVGFKNIGTGFLSNSDSKGAFCTTIEAVTFEDYSYKAIEIKNGLSTVIRSATVGKGKSEKLVPVTIGGNVTVESIGFEKTNCKYALELKNGTSLFLRNIVFNNAKVSSESLVLCDTARFTMQTATLIDTDTKNLISVNDSKDGDFSSNGSVAMIYNESDREITVSENADIICDCILN